MQKKRLRNNGIEITVRNYYKWKTLSKNWFRKTKIDKWKYSNQKYAIGRFYLSFERLDKKLVSWNGYSQRDLKIKRNHNSLEVDRLRKKKRFFV